MSLMSLTVNVILCVFYCNKKPSSVNKCIHCCSVSHRPGSCQLGGRQLLLRLMPARRPAGYNCNRLGAYRLHRLNGLSAFIKWNHPMKTKPPFGLLHICTNTEPWFKFPSISGQTTQQQSQSPHLCQWSVVTATAKLNLRHAAPIIQK